MLEDDYGQEIELDFDNPDIVFQEMNEDCMGNLEVSMYWEEKILLIIKFL